MTTLERGATGSTSGVFANIDEASRAVRMLSEESVPADSIRVLLIDAQGDKTREISVEDEAGALRGALVGGAIGFGVGLIAVVVAAALSIGASIDIGIGSFTGAVAVVAAATAGCIPLGALWGMGRWQGRSKLSAHERADRVVVRVESDELAERANRVLTRAGAVAVLGPGR